MVKGINEGDRVIYGTDKNKKVKDFYQKLYKWEQKPKEIINNVIFNYEIEIDKAIWRIAKDKATEWDNIPEEFFKALSKSEELKQRLKNNFTEYVMNGKIPDYFMKSRLILLSKEDNEAPPVHKTRPISISPTITKIFETSIMQNFEKVLQSHIFSRCQRGFMKGKSTLQNIEDILDYARNLQQSKRSKIINTATIVFFDFEKAYDNVSRDIVIEKLQKLNLLWNITKLIKDMLNKFNLGYYGETIWTYKGLAQGSVLSPLLFNLFINDLLIAFEINGIMVRGYADDIACVWYSLTQTRTAIEIMKNWTETNKMTINPNKSGIIRILLRNGKKKWTPNWLNIPEVKSYWYLGITINQALKMDEHYQMFKNIEIKIMRRISLLKPTFINTKSRLIVFKTILRSKMNYACTIIWNNNDKYAKRCESMIYRLLRSLFWIKVNVNKEKLFNILNV